MLVRGRDHHVDRPPAARRGPRPAAGSLSVHRDGERERLPVYRDAVLRGELPGGWAADDGAALLFRDRALSRVVASAAGRGAARIDAVDGALQEVELAADLLRPEGALQASPPADIREYRLTRRSASR